eukprot:191017-Chlamydomonas_euryale.AAC.3
MISRGAHTTPAQPGASSSRRTTSWAAGRAGQGGRVQVVRGGKGKGEGTPRPLSRAPLAAASRTTLEGISAGGWKWLM